MGSLVALGLTFGVGVLVGQRACTPTQEASKADVATSHTHLLQTPCPQKTVITEVEVPTVVYKCPPKEPPLKKGDAPKVKKPLTPKLPAAEPLRPGQRLELLGWARAQSERLKPCRDDSKEVWRLSVTLELALEDATIKGVRLNGPPGQIPQEALECLRKEIASWRPPAVLAKGQPELVFGLSL